MTKSQQQRTKEFWESGDEGLLNDLHTAVIADRLAEHDKMVAIVQGKLDQTAEAIIACEKAVRTGEIEQVDAQRTRLDALQSDRHNYDQALRNLKADPPSEQPQEERYTLGTWGADSELLFAPWDAPVGPALLLLELREQLQGLDALALTRAEGAALTDDAELLVEQAIFPRLIIQGVPPPGWKEQSSTLQYRLGEEDAFVMTRLLVRCLVPDSQSGRPEYKLVVLACRQNIARGDPSLQDVHDFRPQEVTRPVPFADALAK